MVHVLHMMNNKRGIKLRLKQAWIFSRLCTVQIVWQH